MPKDLYYSRLLDFYDELLKDKSKEVMEYYYNDDLSLSEVADNLNITKQGVHDIIKRAEMQLSCAETKLHLLEKFQNLDKNLQNIKKLSQKIIDKPQDVNTAKLAKEIENLADKIYKENIR